MSRLTLGELVQDFHPFLLGHVASQQADAVAVVLQPGVNVFTDVLGVGEDDGFSPATPLPSGEQQQHLVFVGG